MPDDPDVWLDLPVERGKVFSDVGFGAKVDGVVEPLLLLCEIDAENQKGLAPV